MHNPKFVMENETDKIPCDFEIESGQLIPIIRAERVIVKKKKKKKKKKKDY